MKRTLVISILMAAIAVLGCGNRRRNNGMTTNIAGGQCAALTTCCAAVQANPALAMYAASCAQAPSLAALGANGEPSCQATLTGLRTGLATAPGGLPIACGGTGVAVPTIPTIPTIPTGVMPNSGGGVIAMGGTAAGVLAQGDTTLQDQSVGDDYTIMLVAGQPITIVTRGGPSSSTPGSTLDVYTVLLFNNAEVASDDDGAGYPNSRIVYTPTTTGPHTIRVTTFGSGFKGGSYTLQTYPGALPTQTK